MLTEEQIRQLKRPFAAHEHRFVNGNPYLLKEAIRERLNEVDPGWMNTPPELLDVHECVVVVRGGLTVCGVTRFDEGTGIFQTTRKGKPLEGFDLSREQSKAYKTAMSDLLPRCAGQFGIGAYLRDKPKDVDETQFKNWIGSLLARWHWAYNGAGVKFADAMKEYGVSWEDVRCKLEPGRELRRLSDISMGEATAMKRLLELIEATA